MTLVAAVSVYRNVMVLETGLAVVCVCVCVCVCVWCRQTCVRRGGVGLRLSPTNANDDPNGSRYC